MPDMPDSTNPFDRIKRQLDAHVSAGLQSIFGLPSFVSQSLNPRAFASSDGAEASRANHSAVSSRYEADYKVAYNSRGGGLGGSGAMGRHQPGFGGGDNDNDDAGRVETLINQLSGRSLPEHMAAWRIFLERSQYSPLVVQKTLGQGPPPPRDLLHLGHSYKLVPMWMDAFEDLLLASSAVPMREGADLARELGSWRYGLADVLGLTPEASNAFYRFCDMGVNEAYFPIREKDHVSPGTLEAWRELRRKESRPAKFGSVLSVRSPLSGPELGEVWQSSESSLSRLIRIARDVFKNVDEDAPRPETKEKSLCLRTPFATVMVAAETEQDLYNWQANRDKETDTSGNGPPASFCWSTSSSKTRIENNKTITEETRRNPMGKTVRTMEGYVDEQGNMHVKTRCVVTNAQGHDTTHESHVVQSPTGQHWQEPYTSGEKKTVDKSNRRSEPSDSGNSKGWTGWFW